MVLLPFSLHSSRLGLTGLAAADTLDSRFFAAGKSFGNHAIFGHMVLGGFLTLLVPLQLWGTLRRRAPALHRWCGRLLCGCAVLTGVGGLAYIAVRGTIGGAWMNAGFALYGALLIISALQTVRYALKNRFSDHRTWALRLFVLSIGSWIYRIHYGVWYALTDGLASTPTFEGRFDLIQNFAFYLPYLVALEIWRRWRKPVVIA
ncbi:DUF2306 domain-containing protein [Roseobacter fucihabitans]|uniref:DUF2306 domain-containing protein n=1 Tax=Roseobacter fucihabitans TaxID=1537242 RepID=UPI0038674856